MNTEIIARTAFVGKNIMWRAIMALAKSSIEERDQDSYIRLKEIVEAAHKR